MSTGSPGNHFVTLSHLFMIYYLNFYNFAGYERDEY